MVLADNRIRVVLYKYMAQLEAKYKAIQERLKRVITNHCVGSHQLMSATMATPGSYLGPLIA
jgi:hypothetical protein